MIKGLGTDIVEVDRIGRIMTKNDRFQRMVFNQAETDYCESRGNKFESYAGKFAAKEAFFKSLGTGWDGKVKITDVSVLNDSKGKPYIFLEDQGLDSLGLKNMKIHLSISHTKKFATATVIIED